MKTRAEIKEAIRCGLSDSDRSVFDAADKIETSRFTLNVIDNGSSVEREIERIKGEIELGMRWTKVSK